MKVSVSLADIKDGSRNSAYLNPVARAMNRQAPGEGIWTAFPNSVQWVDADNHLHTPIPLPPSAMAFFEDFITGDATKPFEFEIEAGE